MTAFDLDFYEKVPRAVRYAYRRKEQECVRLEAEIEWLRAKLKDTQQEVAVLKTMIEQTSTMIPLAFREALRRAAKAAPEKAEVFDEIPCPYR